MAEGAARMEVPADEDRLVTTYGYVRDLSRHTETVREGYSEEVRNAQREADLWRDWALSLESIVLKEHPATPRGSECPACGRVMPCGSRRDALAFRKRWEDERVRMEREAAERSLSHAEGRVRALAPRRAS